MIKILSSRDAWALAYVSQFRNILTTDELNDLLKSLSEYGQEILKIMIDVIYENYKGYIDTKEYLTVQGFLSWSKSLKKRKNVSR